MKVKIAYLFVIIFFSCTHDPISSNMENLELSEDDFLWFYNTENQELLIQINTGNLSMELSGLEIKLDPFHSDFFEIFDDGNNSDLIPNNNIYSILISNLSASQNYILNIRTYSDSSDEVKEYEYNIEFNNPVIINNEIYPYVPLEHTLDDNNITFLDLIVAVTDEDGLDDIEYVKYYIKKVNFNNGILLDNGTCDYETVQEDYYIEDPSWIMNYELTNIDGSFLYRVQQPINPFIYESGCGGFGEIQFKFEVKDKKGFVDILEMDETTLILLP